MRKLKLRDVHHIVRKGQGWDLNLGPFDPKPVLITTVSLSKPYHNSLKLELSYPFYIWETEFREENELTHSCTANE
jgi:hypothetical protein